MAAIGADNDSRLAIAAFDGPFGAGQVLDALREAGVATEQVSVVARDDATRKQLVDQTEMSEAPESGSDALAGGLTGGALGGLVGLGALLLPGLGPIVAAGALATAIGGAAAGAAIGGRAGEEAATRAAGVGLAEVLIGQGVPTDDAAGYEARLRANAILVAVEAANEAQALVARDLLAGHQGHDARIYGAALREERIP